MDKLVAWALENWLALVGVLLGCAAIIFQLLDRPRIRISRIHIGFSGSKKPGALITECSIISIEIILENKGSRPAVGCQGVVTFPKTNALKVYPQTKDHFVDTTAVDFNVYSKSKIALAAAWTYTDIGGIDGTKPALTMSEFVNNGLPFKVMVTVGGKKIIRIFKAKEFHKQYEAFQASNNLYNPE